MSRPRITPPMILLAVLLLLAAGNVYFYSQYRQARDTDPTTQTTKIVSELKRSVSLPDGTPSILTVVDRTKLKDRQIADKAQNGDKILVYQQAGQVYIYRPFTGKLVDILKLSPTSAEGTGQ